MISSYIFQLNLLLLFIVSFTNLIGGTNRCPNVAFIMHTYYKTVNITNFSTHTFLGNVSMVIVTGHDVFTVPVEHNTDRRRLIKVNYNGNPGKGTYTTQGVGYKGTHRTMAGLLIANDTYPDAEWYYVFDDDNYVFVEAICEVLGRLNPRVPLLLAGAVGPIHGHGPCRKSSNMTHWSCCTDTSVPCVANIAEAGNYAAYFSYHQPLESFKGTRCDSVRLTNCCRTAPWPEGMGYGYPYSFSGTFPNADALNTYLRGHHAALTPHGVELWPYGGATYATSKALMVAVGRDHWEQYTYGLQCFNADINVMVAVLNKGYSVTEYTELSRCSLHHVKTVETFADIALGVMGDKRGTRPIETDTVKRLVCRWLADDHNTYRVTRPLHEHCAQMGVTVPINN